MCPPTWKRYTCLDAIEVIVSECPAETCRLLFLRPVVEREFLAGLRIGFPIQNYFTLMKDASVHGPYPSLFFRRHQIGILIKYLCKPLASLHKERKPLVLEILSFLPTNNVLFWFY